MKAKKMKGDGSYSDTRMPKQKANVVRQQNKLQKNTERLKKSKGMG